MSIVEKICICADDDMITAIMQKCCLDPVTENAVVVKYQYRTMVSMVFDCLVFPLTVLGYPIVRI
jgi:hypothetical protein